MPASNPTKSEIEVHLREILRSANFQSAGKAATLLQYLVKQFLAGEIPKETTIAVEIFDLPPDYDPQSNSRVRISVARLRKRLAEYYESHPNLTWRLNIPVGSYAIEILHASIETAPQVETPPPPEVFVVSEVSPPLPARSPWFTTKAKFVSVALLLVTVTALSLYSFRTSAGKLLPLPPGFNQVEAWEVRISPDGHHAAASMMERIRVVNLDTGEMREFSLPGPTTSTLRWTADNWLVWCGWDSKGKLSTWLLDRTGLRGQSLVDGFAHASLAPGNNWLAGWLPGERSVVMVSLKDPSDRRRALLTNTQELFNDLEWTPDGKGVIWSVNTNENKAKVRYLGLDGSYAELFTVDDVFSIGGIREDGSMLWVQNAVLENKGYVYVTRLEKTWTEIARDKKLLYTKQGYLKASWDSTGEKMLVAEGKGLPEITIAFFEKDGKLRKTRLTHDRREKYPAQATYESDGLLYEMEATPSLNQIFYQSLDGSKPKQLTFSNANSYSPMMTPDGNWLMFVSTPARSPGGVEVPGDGGIYRIPARALHMEEPPQPVRVSTKGPFQRISCGENRGSRCVIDDLEGTDIVLKEFDPVKGPGRELIRLAIPPEFPPQVSIRRWNISDDGRMISVFSEKIMPGTIQLYTINPDRVVTTPTREITVPELKTLASVTWIGVNHSLEFLITARREGMLELYRYRVGEKPQFIIRRPHGPLWAILAANRKWFAMPETWPDDLKLILVQR